MRRTGIIAGVLVVLALLHGGPFAVAQPMMILPGRSIGPFEIGMPLDRARSLMEGYGKVEEVSDSGSHGFCNPEDGVGVCAFDRVPRLGANTPGRVAYVVTDDERFATEAGGHKVGQPFVEFLKTFGLYTGGQGTEVRWEGRGLSVDITSGDRGLTVQFIGIFAPRAVSAMAPPAR